MVARCDAAVKIFPGSFTAPLIIGTIGGTGGKFLADAITNGAGLSKGFLPTDLHFPLRSNHHTTRHPFLT